VRKRILETAFAAFMKSGYAAASTLEIATRARVSKRELYALVGNKQKMLIASIRERTKRFDVPADLPVLRDRETLAQVLASFGAQLVREVSDPTVIGVFRLATADDWNDLCHFPVADWLQISSSSRFKSVCRKGLWAETVSDSGRLALGHQ